MRNSTSNDSREEDRNKETSSSPSNSDSRFNQTLRNVQGLLKGRSFPGKILITRRLDPLDLSSLHSPNSGPRSLESDTDHRKQVDKSTEDEVENRSSTKASSSVNDTKSSTTGSENTSKEVHRSPVGARATDSARLMKFTKELSGSSVFLEKLRELAWSGVPSHLRPTIWRLLLGYAPSNSDRREGVLKRKRLEYLDCVAQYYDIPDSERTDEEINMLRQIAVDCPRTVPDVSFFQQAEVQKSLERILYIWAIRHPASGYVQGINDLATPFLVVFLSEYLEGSVDTWSMANLSPEQVSNVEADCYWCLTKLLDEPVSRHMEEQGLEFLQFSFRWFNCLLIREIPFRLVTRLWDTYLAEGDALPDFLVYIFASFLLTWSDKLQKLEFQEMVMFLQHVPTQNWSDVELEMVLSQAYMWHTMFNNSPSHFLAG
ncbi:UNVERIFIED_CONTAM: GTPase-activating protein gyp1 [Sesamum latifolium]|uniref:GTPase-activating protein gyp1 n=1 Tax=Sesamum latifolium TaxID=2727402 RepID=A0AAW2VTR4_9LAMI